MLYARTLEAAQSLATAKGQRGACPNCEGDVRSKVGELVRPHWAHVSLKECDSWSEGETPWHLGWKALVRPECCEVTMKEERGGVLFHHRADVVGDRGVVVELQHSPISPETIREREEFYGRMVWVVDGTDLLGRIRMPKGKRLLPGTTPYPDAPTGSGLQAWDDDRWRLQWLNAKVVWTTATKPVFLDLGQPVTVTSDGLVPREKGSSMFRIKSIEQDDHGTWVTGRLITRAAFLRRYLRASLAHEKDIDEVAAEMAQRCIRMQAFREKRREARARARQAEEQRLKEEREFAEFVAWVRRATSAHYDDLVALRDEKAMHDLDARKAEFLRSTGGAAYLDRIEEAMGQRVSEFTDEQLATLKAGLDAKVGAFRGKLHSYVVSSPQRAEVRGPWSQLVITTAKAYGWRWESGAWSGRPCEELRLIVEHENDGIRMHGCLTPKERFLSWKVPNVQAQRARARWKERFEFWMEQGADAFNVADMEKVIEDEPRPMDRLDVPVFLAGLQTQRAKLAELREWEERLAEDEAYYRALDEAEARQAG